MNGTYGARALPTLGERPDRPLVLDAVRTGTAPVVAFAAAPAHPSNAVVVHTRRCGGPTQTTRALREAGPGGESAQWFSAVLPAVEDGAAFDYRAELLRSGQRLACLPADGSWLTVVGAPPPAAPPAATEPPPGPGPSWTYSMEFFATFDVFGRVQPIGETPEGYRIDFLVDGGTVTGPRIRAEIQPGGGDWLCVRRDGVAVLDIRATFRSEDGSACYYRAQGRLDLGPDGYARAVAGDLHGTPPCYVTPTFHTGAAGWEWLNRVQGFGVGRVLLAQSRVSYDVHLPTVGERHA